MKINIYTQGSKILGLGHLSRIVPIYHNLIENNIDVKLFLHGDIIGESYLKINNVQFELTSKKRNYNSKATIWLVDSTDIYEESYELLILSSKVRILLSPKFNSAKQSIFTHAILRSDPFNLLIPEKYVSGKYFIFNKGAFTPKRNLLNVGIALSGSDTKATISEIVDSIINNQNLLKWIGQLTVFLGGTTKLNFERRSLKSHTIDLKFISSLKSLWSFEENIDLFIVGNGTLVDECIVKNKRFILYNNNSDNLKIKSINANLAKENEVRNISQLILLLAEHCNAIKHNQNSVGSETSFQVKSNNPKVVEKILSITTQYN